MKTKAPDELKEIIDAWGNYLKSIEPKLQSSLKKLLNRIVETLGDAKIYALIFEFQKITVYNDCMNLNFYVIDHYKNRLAEEYDLFMEEWGCDTLFPKEFLFQEYNIWKKYRGRRFPWRNGWDFEDYYDGKYSRLLYYFRRCWQKIRDEYNTIPAAYFPYFSGNSKFNLDTKEIIHTANIFESVEDGIHIDDVDLSVDNLSLDRDLTLETFFTGNVSSIPHIAREIINKPGHYNPVLITGSIGQGKTHLLEAIANELSKKQEVIYTSGVRYLNNFERSRKTRNFNKFRNKFCGKAALFIDDLGWLKYSKYSSGAQEELMYIMDTLLNKKIQMVFTLHHLGMMEEFDEKLASRIRGGLTIDLNVLDNAKTKIQIIQNIADHRRLNIEDQEIKKLINNREYDMRHVISYINAREITERIEYKRKRYAK